MSAALVVVLVWSPCSGAAYSLLATWRDWSHKQWLAGLLVLCTFNGLLAYVVKHV